MQKELLRLSAANEGDLCSGFRLVKKEYVPSKHADLYTMRHEKTKAELLYFARADENKTFAIAFKTLPEDDTGVFHILEHSVLNGSRRFPVREPFVNLLQSSMQTFLNAMTYPDKTVYPVCSRNDKDFHNLMEVYLDAVFCPAIYEKPQIFMQEGWHYEFDSEDAEPYYNGVVYSEMKGAFSDVSELMETESMRLLFPDSSYGFVSGGHPESIPKLTYEQFIANHKRYYHPSNARIFLDGKMDIDEILRYIDGEYLSKYDYRAPDFDFTVQKQVVGEKTVSYSVKPGEEAKAHMVFSKLLCAHDEPEKVLAANVLAKYLTGSNEAPLKRTFLEQALCQDISLQVNDGIFQPYITLTIRNTEQEKFAQVEDCLRSSLQDILSGGLDREALLAELERMAFTSREIEEPYGLILGLTALDGWLYGDDPLTYIETAGIYDALRQKADTGYFADLLREMLGDTRTLCKVCLLPSETKAQEDQQAEKARLEADIARWDHAAREKAYADFQVMHQWQETPDSPEALATLPTLTLGDVSEDVAPISVKPEKEKLLRVETESNGITYVNLFFDVSDFDLEELRLLNVLSGCFSKLHTGNTSAQALQTRIKANFGHLSAGIDQMAPPKQLEKCAPYLKVSAAMLEENAPKALPLLAEILTRTLYDESDRIAEIIDQNSYYYRQAMVSNGHMFAMLKAMAPFSREAALQECLRGESYVTWLSDLARSFRENAPAMCEKISALAKRCFAGNRLFAAYTGKLDTALLDTLSAALPESPMGDPARLPAFDTAPAAIEIAADVSYSALGANLYALGSGYTGSVSVLASLMTYGYLWNAVRVRGGAYGTGMRAGSDGNVCCYSYRDPNLASTRAAFAAMADFLEDWLKEDQDLESTIIGTVNTTDPLLGPSAAFSAACSRYLRGVTHEDILRTRRELLRTTREDLRGLLEPLRAFQARAKFCAVGSKDAVAFLK